MKIAIEAQRLFRQHKHGMDIVAIELIRQLQLLDRRNEYFILAADGPDKSGFNVSGNFSVNTSKPVAYPRWEQFGLPAMVRRIRPDVLHCTANTAPLRIGAPLVLTLHDIIYLEKMSFKGSGYQNFGNLYRRMVVPPAIRKAAAIVTVSEFEKQAIITKFPEASSRVTVIHNGVDERFSRAREKPELESFRRDHHLPEQFILLLGNTAPKKNTAGAMLAYEYYCHIAGDPLPLVVADYSPKKTTLSARGRVYYPGYISSAQMPLLYASASLFLYPSLRESFGLPLLEAMAAGTPVIASDTSAIPEIAGDAAVLADPRDHQRLGEVIAHTLADDDLLRQLKTKGALRAGTFSWENAARKLLAVYENVV